MATTATIAPRFVDIADSAEAPARVWCSHCGAACRRGDPYGANGLAFCCQGCRTVFELLAENGLERFYELEQRPGIRPAAGVAVGAFSFLDDAATRRKVVDFSDGKFTRVTFRLPSMHCLACVWLLENLFRLQSGIGQSEVNFPRKEATILFEDSKLTLGALAGFLTALGYEPDLKLTALDRPRAGIGNRRLHLRIGVAGFAFGNVMLLCFPSYLGLPENETQLQPLLGWIAALLATPVFFYCASDYWRAAWRCLRRRMLTVELPIFVGLTALYFQSLDTALRGGGPAYFDSFTGLLLFLLCSRLFQQKTYDALAFDRDFRSYFPLAVTRRSAAGDQPVPVTQLRVGDRILVRNHELIPADATLISGAAHIDYSFVTGEAAPQPRAPGDYLYAGGRQSGAVLELQVAKEISQSYLTALWNHAAFRKGDTSAVANITNVAGRYFTYGVLALAALTGAYWAVTDPSRAVRVLAAVLIVACPCALAMAAPFTLGAALRVLGRQKIYLKNTGVIETLAKSDAIVFDKTGTLTLPARGGVAFEGNPLSPDLEARVRSLAALSTHKLSQWVAAFWGSAPNVRTGEVEDFRELAGAGISGRVDGADVQLGSRRWLEQSGITIADAPSTASEVCLAQNGVYLGRFTFANVYRPGLAGVIARLRRRFTLALISGDNDRERATLAGLFGGAADLRFDQLPDTKLAFIRGLQAQHHTVVMIGDGLNDAGALKQSDVGIAVTEDVGAFSPACDAIWSADQFAALPDVLRFARRVMGVVYVCLAASFGYNAIGLTLAVTGHLSPLVSAVLMPASSLSIIILALAGTRLAAWGTGLKGAVA